MAYQTLRIDQVTVAAAGFKGPEGVVVDRDGNVYGGGADGIIRKLSPDGRVTSSPAPAAGRLEWRLIAKAISSSAMSARPPCSRSRRVEK